MNNNYDPNQQPAYEQQPQQTEYQAPLYEQKPVPDALPMLIMAIIGLALGAIPGIILCAIALSKIKGYVAVGGILEGKAKVANILAKIGLILSIVSSVFWVIYFIVIIIVAIAGAASTPSYDYYGGYYY